MKRLLLPIAASLLAASAFARTSPALFPVSINVSASSDSEKAEVYADLARELRKLPDVAVVDSRDQAVFTLEVIVNDIQANGKTIGNTVSLVTTMEIPDAWLAPPARDLLKAFRSSPRLYDDALLEHDAAGNLDGICKDLIATVDGRELAAWRKIIASAARQGRD